MRCFETLGLALGTALLLSCGGGGGGSTAVATSTPALSMSLSTSQLTATASVQDVAPTPTVTVTLSSAPTTDLYLGVKAAQGTLANVSSQALSSTSVLVTFTLNSPSAMGVGTYTDTYSVGVFTDAQGSHPIGNSPQNIAMTYTVTATPPPTLASLSPSQATAGDPGFLLQVTGTGFTYGSVLQWNGSPKSTTFVSSTQLTAQISAADLAVAGTVSVTVSNPANAGGTSNALDFTIQAPAFGITSVAPNPVTVGGPDFTLTVKGAQFVASSVVQWNGSPRPTTFVSSTQLTAQIGAADVAAAGSAAITVLNPAGQGGLSNTVSLAISAPSAVCFQINPAHTGAVTFSSVSLPSSQAWSVTLDGPPSYALIAQGLVIVTLPITGGGSELLALDQATGAKVWGPILIGGIGNAVYDSGRVFVLHTSGGFGSGAMLEAYDAATGAAKWSANLPGQYALDAAPTALNGIVYATESGVGVTLYAFDGSNGALLWSQLLMAGDACAPAVTQDGVYVTYPYIAADFNPITGARIWYDAPGGDGGGGAIPVVANGVVYAPNGFGTYNGQMLNAQNGALLGSYLADNPPAIGTDKGFFLQGGALRAISLANNTILWSFAGDGQLTTSPILVNDYVMVGSASGTLYGLDAATGTPVWTQSLGAAIPRGAGWDAQIPLSGLSAGNGYLVVPAGNTLTAFKLQ